MNVRIGDIVRFISEKLEGKVTGIVDKDTVNVFCDEYGFEIPASVNDLVIIHSDFRTNPSAETNVPNDQLPHQQSITMQSADTLYLAIVPDQFSNLLASRYEFFLVNDTSQTCLYSVAFRNNEKYTGISAGHCTPDEPCSLGSYTLKDIDATIKAIRIQAVFFKKGTTIPRNPVDTEIKINNVNLCKSGSYKHSRWFNAISLLRPLEKEQWDELEDIDEKQLEKALKEKKVTEHTKVVARHPQKQMVGNILEIDVHCDELLETTAGMESKDILEYQLDIFRKTMEEYKLRRGQKIVFIHGKGDGILRQRILWELQTKYKRHHHQDASFKQYGYGATMVTIK